MEGAFAFSPSVLTLSFHKHDLGFFPGTGGLNDIGKGPGQYRSVNVPLKGGMNSSSFASLFTMVTEAMVAAFDPTAVVIQCGADALAGDPTKAFNISSECYAQCLRQVLRWGLPTLVLGGGGYNNCNTAKCWALLTAVCLEDPASPPLKLAGLSEDLPEHDQLGDFSGDYLLPVQETNMKNENTPGELHLLFEKIQKNLECLANERKENEGNEETEKDAEQESESSDGVEAEHEAEGDADEEPEETNNGRDAGDQQEKVPEVKKGQAEEEDSWLKFE